MLVELLGEHRQAWLELRTALWPDCTPSESLREMDEILENPREIAFGYFVDGVLAGFAEMNLRTEAPGCTPGDIAYLEGWYVRPEHRRKGIGRALVEAGIEWGRAKGCGELASDTDQDYPLSPAAHAALGFEEVGRKVFFRRRIRDPETESPEKAGPGIPPAGPEKAGPPRHPDLHKG